MRRYRIKTLKIDGQDIGGREDETLLQLARQNGIDIPTLCHVDGLSASGGCRMCLVEVKGSDRLLPACITYPEEGMEVFTQTEQLLKYRRMILDLFFSERNHVCAVCVSNGHCDLQSMAARMGITSIGVPYLTPEMPIDASHQYFVIDHNRCILCTRCVRVCREIEGAQTKGVSGRGIESRIIADLSKAWGESASCTSCGKCVQVCPTGALTAKGRSVAEMAKRREFLSYLQIMRDE